jgi:hypothetical protein
MTDEPFKNREILEMFNDLKGGNERIETQVKLTNGRVTQLEVWKYISMGATGVLTLIVIPILSWALWVLVNIQGQVHNAVNEALSVYEINVK